MHRSRLSLLVVVASVGGCSTRRDDSGGKKVLAQDPALAAQIDTQQKTHQGSLPEECSAIVVAAPPASSIKSRAEKLAREGYSAEMLGNLRQARELLSRASKLDGTDKSAAYHLGRTNEALGDRDAATLAYCRFLKLTTVESAESAEARQRVEALSQSMVRVASGSVSSRTSTARRVPAATTRRTIRRQSTDEHRVVARAPLEQPAHAATTGRATQPASVVSRGNVTSPSTINAPKTSTVDSSAGADVALPTAPVSTVDQPPTATRTTSRYPTRAQGAAIGAVTGGILGAVAGRSVKAVAIGAAAGGILGTAVGRGSRGS